jgi:hypothetical protein
VILLKIFLIQQRYNNDYDTYDSAVVVAKDVESARLTHPSPYHDEPKPWNGEITDVFSQWAPSKYVEVIEIGDAHPDQHEGVVLASFNAG